VTLTLAPTMGALVAASTTRPRISPGPVEGGLGLAGLAWAAAGGVVRNAMTAKAAALARRFTLAPEVARKGGEVRRALTQILAY
jgi:hypothetical protein